MFVDNSANDFCLSRNLSEKDHIFEVSDVKANFLQVLKEVGKDLHLECFDIAMEMTNALDCLCEIGHSKIFICPLFLIDKIELIPPSLRPIGPTDPRLDKEEYWLELDNWISKAFSLPPAEKNLDIPILKQNILALMTDPKWRLESLKNYIKPSLKQMVYHKRLQDIVLPIMKEVNFEKIETTKIRFSNPIDPTMAFADKTSIHICPLFIIDLQTIPEGFRPKGSSDPKLYDLNFLQGLSDWIAKEYGVQKQKVGLAEIAAVKTILKLREDPINCQKALKAGLVHELGHVSLQHVEKFDNYDSEIMKSAVKWGRTIGLLTSVSLAALTGLSNLPVSIKFGSLAAVAALGIFENYVIKKTYYYANKASHLKTIEREADHYAATRLKDGVEGFKFGFTAWQDMLKEMRSNPQLTLKDRMLMKFLITPKGNPVPLLFTHGSFEDRIQRAEAAAQECH